MDAETIIAAGTLVASALWMGYQARNLRNVAQLATSKMREEADRFERSIAFEREKFDHDRQQWREERRDTKRAEVAGEVLVGLGDYLRALGHMMTPPDEWDDRFMQQAVDEAWGGFRKHTEALAAIRTKCAAFLPDDAVWLCERIRVLEDQLYEGQMRAAGNDHTAERWAEAFDAAPRKKIEEMERESWLVLRPYASLSPTKATNPPAHGSPDRSGA